MATAAIGSKCHAELDRQAGPWRSAPIADGPATAVPQQDLRGDVGQRKISVDNRGWIDECSDKRKLKEWQIARQGDQQGCIVSGRGSEFLCRSRAGHRKASAELVVIRIHGDGVSIP